MLKRPRSPGLQPPSKRQHNDRPNASGPVHASFDQLWDEIVLVIFSYLSYKDLCTVQSISQNWARLALDNQLWKKLYLDEYGRARLRGGRGFVGREDGREIKPLPDRAKHGDSEDLRDWKWMFRISCNWRSGRCAVEQWRPPGSNPEGLSQTGSHTHISVLLAGYLIITSAVESGQPALLLAPSGQPTLTLSCQTRRTNAHTVIHSIVLDQSPPTNAHKARLVAFLSTAEFVVFSIDHHHPAQSSRILTYSPAVPTPRTSNIFHAVFHENLLVTLSQTFHLSVYDLSSGTVTLSQTLSSFTSYPPSSMVLTPITPTTYKLIIAYAVPIYPAHWSVGATELMISSELSTMSVMSSRTIRAFDPPIGWIDAQKLRAMREQWGRKVARVADTQTDGKWVVVAPSEASPTSHRDQEDNASTVSTHTTTSLHSPGSLQLYRLSFPTSSSSSPKLVFVRMLHGQVGPCSALSLADGRCVSLGVNGSIWVWDLEGGMGTEVDQGDAEAAYVGTSGSVVATKGTIAFDERRIVSAGRNGVEVRRFDV